MEEEASNLGWDDQGHHSGIRIDEPAPVVLGATFSDSTNIHAFSWDAGTLIVEFVSGAVYVYTGVPESVAHEWLVAESAGKFFATRIRNAYPYIRKTEA